MKKCIYIILTIILGMILSFIAHAVIEIAYLKYAQAKNFSIVWNSTFGATCALPALVQILLVIFGIIGGYFLGQYWWRIIYIEKRFGKIKY